MIADDASLLSILNSVENLPRHNVLFAGVQYVMMRDGAGDLGLFYPNFTDEVADMDGIADVFGAFVRANAVELLELGRTRYTQTNESRRCVALLPGIWKTPATSFHLVDVGTSAGLNLHLDRYHYQWDATTWGSDSPVSLQTTMRGAGVVPREIDVLSRTGLDLNPIDPSDPNDRRWLEALIWPEHHERRKRLRASLVIAAENPVDMVKGDLFETLSKTLDSLPKRQPVVVLNSFILNQFAPERRDTLVGIFEEAGTDREIYRVSLEWLDENAEGADLGVSDGSGLVNVGVAQPHGEWLELYARP